LFLLFSLHLFSTSYLKMDITLEKLRKYFPALPQRREREDNKKNRGGAEERNRGDRREGKKQLPLTPPPAPPPFLPATTNNTATYQSHHQPLLHQLHRSKPFGHQELSLPPLFLPLQIFFSFFLPASATVYHHRLHPSAFHASQTTVITGQPSSPLLLLLLLPRCSLHEQ
jgi:hypothetical protein